MFIAQIVCEILIFLQISSEKYKNMHVHVFFDKEIGQLTWQWVTAVICLSVQMLKYGLPNF
jgi:hypothetical protein